MTENNSEKETEELQAKIEKALELALEYGGIDGEHHKCWVIDQMVRVLTGCPTVQQKGKNTRGKKYIYYTLGESEKYKEFVRKAQGEDGQETYEWDKWDIGICP